MNPRHHTMILCALASVIREVAPNDPTDQRWISDMANRMSMYVRHGIDAWVKDEGQRGPPPLPLSMKAHQVEVVSLIMATAAALFQDPAETRRVLFETAKLFETAALEITD